MGFMDKVKAAAGVGTPTMVVEIKQKPTRRGEDLIALVRLTGGKQTHKLNYVVCDVRWMGKWAQPLADGRTVAHDGHAIFYRFNQQGSEGVMLEAGKVMEFPLTVKIPMEGPLTSTDCKYDFGVRADLDDVADPAFNTQLDITG